MYFLLYADVIFMFLGIVLYFFALTFDIRLWVIKCLLSVIFDWLANIIISKSISINKEDTRKCDTFPSVFSGFLVLLLFLWVCLLLAFVVLSLACNMCYAIWVKKMCVFVACAMFDWSCLFCLMACCKILYIRILCIVLIEKAIKHVQL